MNKVLKAIDTLKNVDTGASGTDAINIIEQAFNELHASKEPFNIGDVVYNKDGKRPLIILRKAWVVCYENQTNYDHFVEERYLTHTKPLQKITKEELAEMGYVLVK